jgi:hypothetical protein
VTGDASSPDSVAASAASKVVLGVTLDAACTVAAGAAAKAAPVSASA